MGTQNSNCITKCLNPVYSSCVFYSGDNIENTYFTICQGDTLDSIISQFSDTLTSLSETCKVKVSDSDNCCGYLEDKIVSTDESIDVSVSTYTDDDGNTCKRLDLSTSFTYNILYNNWVNTVNTSDDLIESYFVDAGVLEHDGDQVILETSVVCTANDVDDTAQVRFQVNGSNILPYMSLIANWSGGTKAVITRINSTTVRIRHEITYYDASGIQMDKQVVTTSNTTVPDLDSNSLEISYIESGGGGTVYIQYFDVKIFKIQV